MQRLQDIIAANRSHGTAGVCAACTAHPVAIEAALRQGRRDGTLVLIEATPNQVSPFGGYAGLHPDGFRARVESLARKSGVAGKDILLGGDHLGPGGWADGPATPAMGKARSLVAAYAASGFGKLHLDTSMACADDPRPLPGEVAARRAAELCWVAEQTVRASAGAARPLYVIGTEVPSPGGAAAGAAGDPVTERGAACDTLEAHRRAFRERNLGSAWERVIALVVQPGVEFDNAGVRAYAPDAGAPLSEWIVGVPGMVFEVHSTDYQPVAALAALVRGHFAILKVGPQLTHAVREALFGLDRIEAELVPERERAGLLSVCDRAMRAVPCHWRRHCADDGRGGRAARLYGFSDRVRYYWRDAGVVSAVERLVRNLSGVSIPLPLIAQYLPHQYEAVRGGVLEARPEHLVRHHVMRVTQGYARACGAVGGGARQPHRART